MELSKKRKTGDVIDGGCAVAVYDAFDMPHCCRSRGAACTGRFWMPIISKNRLVLIDILSPINMVRFEASTKTGNTLATQTFDLNGHAHKRLEFSQLNPPGTHSVTWC